MIIVDNCSNDVIAKSIKNVKSHYFLLLPDLSWKRMGWLKKKIFTKRK